ncbi:MAG: cytochrome d ubiquinol oxidase subunit II, partial [Parabacteroides sp.]|nr:cytochrome d ubiquinol oxidase subunit II [Parabacteroides sp.]
METLYILQHYWWALISLLGAILVFLMFVQGGQSLLFGTARNESDRTLILNTFGHKWELTFTTLVTFGGAAFAAYPLFYSTSFGGAFWLWMSILLLFVLQAVSYEYRGKIDNLLGARTYEIFLFLNGTLGCLLLGVAVGMFFTGGAFTIDK